jgi:flagellar biosynthesis chaperone FliJ
MEDLNKGIKFTQGVPQNKWDRGKYMEMYETQYKEALERLEKFKRDGQEMEQKLVSHGASEIEIENWKFGRTNEYIQLLERVIQYKKQIEWMDRGLRQLTWDKIHLLESMI